MLTASEFGTKKAKDELEEGFTEPESDFYSYEGQKDLLFEFTGEKLDPEDDESQEILIDMERAYFDVWDDVG